MAAALRDLKSYVTTNTGAQNQAESTVLLMVTHSNLKARFMEIRFDRHMSVLRVKEKLMTHCGSNVSTMRLQLKDWDGALVAEMCEDAKMLGYYSPEDGWYIHVIDSDAASASAGGWLEDVSKVKKYEMSDEEYGRRADSYRGWKQAQVAKDPTWCLEKHMAEKRGEVWVPPVKVEDEEHMAEEAAALGPAPVGTRCEVNPGGKRGTVQFVGKVEGLPLGWWVGVEFDEPVGKNSGSVNGKTYFECPDGYGSFQRPTNVVAGDFPVIDEFASDDEI
mmetsp:Transcript_2181/g.4883  ORF Transcript_2181/g.4883 Transcript_2181/m.4883 type:complete len:276 (-) Transcript_2181:181-1008(-)|eukprot:CAMPEP_0197587306 /NCGR_PEP_ID=MMETSP1326-20131121/8975_1 /TAXON_ID=1155430 /ORGANISM="Genus nov. species nov., Strain RCC2288" /LENGTH=275 /DNA_ID=CAMNT_0043152017 /DNA_START=212 /DNA_END=1039 /DNA_ORIENTATION=+